jgi:7-keto-8-aminopelargonate synthetase-like enzyme
MGRNFPSATQLVHEMIGELKPLSEMLAPQDRWILNRFYEYALNNRTAIANAASLMPMEATLLIILLEERKRTNQAIHELQAEIAKIRQEQKRLGQAGGDAEQPAGIITTQDDGP